MLGGLAASAGVPAHSDRPPPIDHKTLHPLPVGDGERRGVACRTLSGLRALSATRLEAQGNGTRTEWVSAAPRVAPAGLPKRREASSSDIAGPEWLLAAVGRAVGLAKRLEMSSSIARPERLLSAITRVTGLAQRLEMPRSVVARPEWLLAAVGRAPTGLANRLDLSHSAAVAE